MTTNHKRYIRSRIYYWIDEVSWQWSRHREGFFCGFAFGSFVVLMAFYFVVGLTQ